MLPPKLKKIITNIAAKTQVKHVIAVLCVQTVITICYATPNISGIPKGIAEEYFSGGRNGTVFNTSSRCMEMPAPAVGADAKLSEQFAEGEAIFEADFVTDPKAPFGGLGPVYVNSSCRNCHPNYGRARRVEKYTEQFGNGYTTFVHTPDGKLVDGYMFMLQTKAVPPFEPPAKGVNLKWKKFVDEYNNTYPDGTPYNQGTSREGELIYPEADLIEPLLPLPDNYRVSIEATIGLYGTGLLDAIDDADIIAEYERQQAMPGPVKGQHGPWITEPYDGKKHLGKFAWHNTRATLRNGPGFNGIWNVANITRKDRPKLFTSELWVKKQAELGHNISELTSHQPVELSEEELQNLVVWFSGLAVPAARNLNDPVVIRGRELFNQASCTDCHHPSWTTGKSDIIPGYENQKIWPYTDLLMHDMGKANCTACHQSETIVTPTYDVPSLEEIGPLTDELIQRRAKRNHGVKNMNHGVRKTFRTPPLWARGLMKTAVDHTDMWHDLRARSFEEVILWHYGEALNAREAFRNMSKSDREALIQFLKSI
ncbi:MAG TPA: thiol oxidoreductase [Phycisphaerales bacterium]|nr:thiol oxidoreductase [Phycisphaerales bacterium]HCD31275.1 thiol oxidoreductase [Phycisphaerales bacterium]|tara:strand:+ start:1215 stop:2834 length:1620 start_codon:yes stop_codon:yes gene_type:complete